MADRTKIEWSDATWNPVTGCTKVSPGCDHCYAERVTERFHGKGSFATVTLHPQRLDQPLRWRRPRRIFVNSMSDLFHQDVPDEFIARVWAVMAWSPRHTFQVLTKRHARMRSLLSSSAWLDLVDAEWCGLVDWFEGRLPDPDLVNVPNPRYDGPLPNVWLGVSVENQQWADIRIPHLLDTPAAVRFLSCEPLLGPVDIINGLGDSWLTGIDWVIVGGESGPGARPMHPTWARSLRDQCVSAGVPFLFKQHGEWAPVEPDEWQSRRETDWLIRADGLHWPLAQPHGADDGTEVTVRRVGKKAAGRELDGRTWDEYPRTAASVTP